MLLLLGWARQGAQRAAQPGKVRRNAPSPRRQPYHLDLYVDQALSCWSICRYNYERRGERRCPASCVHVPAADSCKRGASCHLSRRCFRPACPAHAGPLTLICLSVRHCQDGVSRFEPQDAEACARGASSLLMASNLHASLVEHSTWGFCRPGLAALPCMLSPPARPRS